MKKKEFDKNIKIISLANNELQGLNLKSILYTPIPYRIPVAFADPTNSADDTKKYIKENYSKEEQENLKYNDKINTAFFNELSKLNKPSEKEAAELAKKYSSKLKAIKYKAPDDLRNITTDDNIDTMKGYFVIDSNALINKNGELLIEFLNLDFNIFNHFLVFFTKYFGMFIDSFNDIDFKNIKIDELTDINSIVSLAKQAYSAHKNDIISIQNLFADFVNILYGYDNNEDINSLTLKQKFYVFYEEHKLELNKFATDYQHNGLFYFNYSPMYKDNLKHKNTAELISKINEFDKNGTKISNNYSISTENIYTVFYISLYNLVLNNNAFIRQCKNCHKYFLTSKSNTFYCTNIYYDNKTCREVGNQLAQKRKEEADPVYNRYRKLLSKKSMNVLRNKDIDKYKKDYENFKEEANKIKKDIKDGTKTYDDFNKWLDGQE